MSDKIEVIGKNGQAAGRDINNISISNGGRILFDPKAMAEIIDALYNDMITTEASLNDFSHITLDQKNQLNEIDNNFFNDYIREYLEYFDLIDTFFKNPINKKYARKYRYILYEIRSHIGARQMAGEKLHFILPSLFDHAKAATPELFTGKSYLLNILAYYMYANCDIGRKTNAETR